MRIQVDHLTRMAGGFICVAGLDETGRHVRPVLARGRLPVSLLAELGGPFAVGAIVDLGPTTPVGRAPELEDRLFDPTRATQTGSSDHALLWSRLAADAELSLVDIFGHDLRNERKAAVVPVGAGRASLGTLEPGYRLRLRIVEGKPRCTITDPELGPLDLSVTDVSFYRHTDDGWIPVDGRLRDIEGDLAQDRPVLVSVGLGRPWPASNPMHWLQVNTIHLEP